MNENADECASRGEVRDGTKLAQTLKAGRVDGALVLADDVAQVRNAGREEARLVQVDEEARLDDELQHVIECCEVIVDDFAVRMALGFDENVVNVARDRARDDEVVEDFVDEVLQLAGAVDQAHGHTRDGEVSPRRGDGAEKLRGIVEADLVEALLQVHDREHVVPSRGLEKGRDRGQVDVLLGRGSVERLEVPAQPVVVGAWFTGGYKRREPRWVFARA